MFAGTKIATAAVTGVLSLAVTGAAAFAAFQPAATTQVSSTTDTGAMSAQADREGKGDRVKEILDRLVKDGTITQAQEDAILKAFKEAAGHREEGSIVKRVLADLMKLSADYLGLDKEKLGEQLKAGKSLGEIANAAPGKSREGLITYDVTQVSAQLDQAVAEGKITKERAAEVKGGLVEHVTKFVDHKFERKPAAAKRDGKHERKHPLPSPTANPTT